MSFAPAMHAELEQEAKTTRRFLERIPRDQLNWRPHEKSMSAGELGLHIARLLAGVSRMAMTDPCPVPTKGDGDAQPSSVDEIVLTFDDSVAAALDLLRSLDDAKLAETWRMEEDGEIVLTMTRGAFLRSFLLNHLYHHRGQLGVYLRLLGANVPAAYGPSGDEMPAGFEEESQSGEMTPAG